MDVGRLGTCIKALTPAGAQLYFSPDGDVPLQSAVAAAEAIGRERLVVFAFPTPQDVGATSAKPAGNVSNAAQVVGAMRQAFRDCYNQALATMPDAEGTIRLTIKVRADGTVSDTAAIVTGKLGTAVECVRSVAGRAKFEPPEGGSAVIKVPVTFVRTENATPGAPRCGRR
ncbi:MAG: hypothetical protein AMXMBFR56_52140 [Polyangiaceae bacterium]